MDAPQVLISGLKFKKSLRECAPEEHGALGPPLQELLFTTRVDGPPEQNIVKRLTKIIIKQKVTTPTTDPKTIGEALTVFCVALDKFSINRPDISALCYALRQYRGLIDQH